MDFVTITTIDYYNFTFGQTYGGSGLYIESDGNNNTTIEIIGYIFYSNG